MEWHENALVCCQLMRVYVCLSIHKRASFTLLWVSLRKIAIKINALFCKSCARIRNRSSLISVSVTSPKQEHSPSLTWCNKCNAVALFMQVREQEVKWLCWFIHPCFSSPSSSLITCCVNLAQLHARGQLIFNRDMRECMWLLYTILSSSKKNVLYFPSVLCADLLQFEGKDTCLPLDYFCPNVNSYSSSIWRFQVKGTAFSTL